MDEAHAEGVTEDEVDSLLLAQVGEPVPGEKALAADDEVGAERGERGEQGVRTAREIAVQNRPSLAVEDAEEHRPRVQIDAAGVPVGPGVDSHAVPPLEGLLTTLKATVWVAPEEACMSFISFQRTAALRASAAELMIR
jgi:hypothetical protein